MIKILIADDSDMMRKIAKMTIGKDGYEVIEASNGAQAVELATREQPQLILLDAEMPEMDGWEATKLLKSNPLTAAIPILICTGHDLSDEDVLVKESGISGYVSKPYNPAQMILKIKEVLGK
jgi:two-component system, cell cycle response regulator DivK